MSMDELTHHDPPPGKRDPRRGALLLYLVGMIVALGVSPVLSVLESNAVDSTVAMFLMPICLLTPFFVTVGYSFALPLLWFRTTIGRYGMGALVPLPLWILFLLGTWLTYPDPDGKMWSQITACFVLALIGGCVPISLVMGIGRWRLGIGATDPIPIGVNDLFALITFVAVVFASLRHAGLFGDLEIGLMILIIAFYSLIGAVVFASLLLAMRMVLGADDRPLRPRNLLGVVLTMLLMTSVWSTLLISNDGVFSQSTSPILHLFLFSAISWLVAAGTALAIGCWLRRFEFRLTTAAMDR